MATDKDPRSSMVSYDHRYSIGRLRASLPYNGMMSAVFHSFRTAGANYSRSSSTSLASSSGSCVTSSAPRLQGFIATLKETFGFIETAEHEKEVFFHFTMFDGEPTDLELGDEVIYLNIVTSFSFFRLS